MRSLTGFIAVLLFVSPAWVTASEHCPADFDGNGVVNAADLAELLAAWGPCEVCGDGVVEGPEECDPPDGETCDDNCLIILPDCCFPDGHPFEGCEDLDCRSEVCAVDPTCCGEAWSAECAVAAAELCPDCAGLDCCLGYSIKMVGFFQGAG